MSDKSEQRNLILAIVLSVVILLGFQFIFAPEPVAPTDQTQQQAGAPAPGQPAQAPGVAAPGAPRAATRAEALKAVERIRIDTPSLHGSIALQGGRIDDLTLVDYHLEPDPRSPEIVLLSPPGAPNPYYAEFGWVPAPGQTVAVPGPDTVWEHVEGGPLTPGKPVVLAWDNGQGLRFVRTITVDQNYLFTVSQRVENQTGQPVSLHPYALISRTGKPTDLQDMYILHEGPLGVFDSTLNEVDYSELEEEGTIQRQSTGGWIGITDKYWLTALAPGQAAPVSMRMTYGGAGATGAAPKYQTDFLGPVVTVAPGASAEDTTRLFAGAKKLELLDQYGEQFGIQRFDLAIDFGWFYFMTKPFFYILKTFNAWFGNFGLAILALTVIVKLALFPLANKSYKAMSKMKKLQPEVQKLQERFGDDRMRLNQELMALYKREKANPVAGCLPILIQIPIFFALYKVLFVTIEMRHAPFYGWINDLSAPDPTSIFNLFGLIPWDPPSFLMIGIWPLIMGATMFLQQKLNPQPTDPIQAKMFTFLPIVFTFLLATFPAGLVIYWAWSNTLSILQQWVIMKKEGVKF